MDTDKLMAAACPLIRDYGPAYYFTPATGARGKELGLDLFRFYFLGRGGVLGDVEPEVVISAFGYFHPDVVRTMWDSARAVLPPREAARAHFDCAAQLGREKLTGVEGLDAYCAAADAVNQAADYVGLPLYAGWRGEPLADDVPARALQLTALLREFRGGAHLLAVRASGLSAKVAHAVTRPNDVEMFGWPAEAASEVTDADRAAMAAAEALTDDLVRPAYGVLDDAGATALVTGIESIAAALSV